MNSLTKQLTSELRPRAALVAYSGEDELRNHYFLELRPIDSQGRMCAARPITVDFMNELANSYSEARNGTPHGLIPANLLFADSRQGSERYVWFNPPQRRMMFFSSNLGIENGEYNMPGIVYEAVGERLSVYACKDSHPTEKTELFTAPFFNVTRASVCLGSAKLEKPSAPTYTELLEFWEKKFWFTEFTHLGGEGNPTHSNLVLVTKAARDAAFDLKELKTLKQTLKNLLK